MLSHVTNWQFVSWIMDYAPNTTSKKRERKNITRSLIFESVLWKTTLAMHTKSAQTYRMSLVNFKFITHSNSFRKIVVRFTFCGAILKWWWWESTVKSIRCYEHWTICYRTNDKKPRSNHLETRHVEMKVLNAHYRFIFLPVVWLQECNRVCLTIVGI